MCSETVSNEEMSVRWEDMRRRQNDKTEHGRARRGGMRLCELRLSAGGDGMKEERGEGKEGEQGTLGMR